MNRRTSVYFEAKLHQALRLKAAVVGGSISDLVNEAVKLSLGEDAVDLAALKTRANEPSISFESMVADLHARGKL